MITNTDIFFIVLFVVVVSIIIGLNLVSVIDKKISNVSVNIPPIKVPKPIITVNIDKKKLCTAEYEPDVEVEYIKDKPVQKVLQEGKEKTKIEPFIVSDAQDIHNYKELRNKTLKQSNTYQKEDIDNPLHQDTVDYDDPKKDKEFAMRIMHDEILYPDRTITRRPKAYVTDVDFGWEAPKQITSCANSSIGARYGRGKHSLMPNQISCDCANKYTAENYYKTHFKKQVIPIEDKKVRGYNYLDYATSIPPYAIDFRILSQATKGLNPKDDRLRNIPHGFNYAFHNTPAMSMP